MLHISEYLKLKETQIRPNSLRYYSLWLKRLEELGDLSTFKEFVLEHQPKSAHYALSIIKSYFKWCHEKGYSAPTSLECRIPRVPIDHHEPITDMEHDALLSQYTPNTFHGMRNRLIFSMLYDTGVRVGELVSIQIHHVDFLLQGAEIVTEKSYNRRPVRWGAETQRLLEKYLPLRNELGDDTHLFINLDRKTKLTARSVERIMEAGLKRAGIKTKRTPHSYRNTWALNRRREGWPIPAVQYGLGHLNPMATLAIYTRYESPEYAMLAKNYFDGRPKTKSNIAERDSKTFQKNDIRKGRGDFGYIPPKSI